MLCYEENLPYLVLRFKKKHVDTQYLLISAWIGPFLGYKKSKFMKIEF